VVNESRRSATNIDGTFLSNHAYVLICIAQEPGVRLREVAAREGYAGAAGPTTSGPDEEEGAHPQTGHGAVEKVRRLEQPGDPPRADRPRSIFNSGDGRCEESLIAWAMARWAGADSWQVPPSWRRRRVAR